MNALDVGWFALLSARETDTFLPRLLVRVCRRHALVFSFIVIFVDLHSDATCLCLMDRSGSFTVMDVSARLSELRIDWLLLQLESDYFLISFTF